MGALGFKASSNMFRVSGIKVQLSGFRSKLGYQWSVGDSEEGFFDIAGNQTNEVLGVSLLSKTHSLVKV